ncbi:hypothetical protein MRS44_017534 [Fusarium solani]|uniref:uncharacterized protein n=1 Tax=Fusarium solani TaxID=169388 RepID=UPI0032C45D76|nr:hypothetical protein MRS44_017534 [Fusarium solani]
MEAVGMITESSCIVIRGISDYADSHKNDHWHYYAAATAAACAKELLSYLDPGDAESPRPGSELPPGHESREMLSPRPWRPNPDRHLEPEYEGSDIDTKGSGSEDGLDVLERVHYEDYCPSPPKFQGHGSRDDSDDEEQHGRKRCRVSRPPHTSVRSTPASARSSRQRRSTRYTTQLPRGRRTSVCGIESPTPSQVRPVPSEASTFLARFEE